MPTSIRGGTIRLLRLFISLAIVAIALTACQAAADPPRTVALQTLNGSGVTGTVSFASTGDKTAVEVAVEPADNLDMPAHIHPGSCDDLTPQPKFPLENVQNGRSRTVVPANLDELFAGDLAVNIHRSNDDLKTYTACVNLR